VLFPTDNAVDVLAARLGFTWANLTSARRAAIATRDELAARLTGCSSDDATVVFSGSLARQEFTPQSDADWILLIDGPAGPHHLDLQEEVRAKVREVIENEPGPEGTFGSLIFSHDLVHQIGGEEDTNRNTTQRILLLLESTPASRPDAYERVVRAVLQRYLLEDQRLWREGGELRVPWFLLNDFARYWRTMAVDFAYKRRSRHGDGAVLRNIKLRMSRKLLYVSALLICFGCDEQFASLKSFATGAHAAAPEERAALGIDYLRHQFSHSPLEVLAAKLLQHEHLLPVAGKLFTAYDAFIGILADPERRNRLRNLMPRLGGG
jgi:hypothetical protein